MGGVCKTIVFMFIFATEKISQLIMADVDLILSYFSDSQPFGIFSM